MRCMQVCIFFVWRIEDLYAHLWTCIQCLVRNDLTWDLLDVTGQQCGVAFFLFHFKRCSLHSGYNYF